MGSTEFTIILAITAACGVWGLAQLIISRLSPEQRKLQQRLATAGKAPAQQGNTPAIQLQHRPTLTGPLGRIAFCRWLNHRLIQAFPDAKLGMFLAIMVLLGVIGFAIATLATESAGAGLAGGLAAAYLPLMMVNGRRAKRQKILTAQLPEALDFLTRVLRAGHSLSTGLQMMGDELPDPLAAEFRRCYAQHSLGQPLDEALRESATRIESTDFAFFVTAVLIQRQTGGDLSEVLSNIAAMIRQRLRIVQHVKAVTAEGRLTSYILVAFPILLFAISYAMNPEYSGVLLRTDTGRMLLGVATVLVTLGMVVIRKIVNVKV
jgi:tight adherence protein B